jgi:hypothetical protein
LNQCYSETFPKILFQQYRPAADLGQAGQEMTGCNISGYPLTEPFPIRYAL